MLILCICILVFITGIDTLGKQAEVQPAETHPLYLCQFTFYGCVFNYQSLPVWPSTNMVSIGISIRGLSIFMSSAITHHYNAQLFFLVQIFSKAKSHSKS